MLSKSQIKFITSLQQKKYRKEHQMFLVEGVKTIEEFLNSQYDLHQLYVTDQTLFSAQNPVFILDQHMKKITCLKSPSPALAVFKMKHETINLNADELIVALDDVRDPGNLGTIIRLCDWYGITNVICSENTVDCYNAKVIQATMGSLTRVSVQYTALASLLASNKIESFGTFMEGENIYQTALPEKGIIVFGNEANGIRQEVAQQVSRQLSIPRFGSQQKTESLNVAMATAIVLSEFKRGGFTEK